MKLLRFIFLLGLVVVLSIYPSHYVRGDAAPPNVQPGSSVGVEREPTFVQMVSEHVVLSIKGDYDVSLPHEQLLRQSLLAAHVDATFHMRNQGDVPESFYVRFPFGIPSGYGDDATVLNFAVWMNDVPTTYQVITEPGEDPYNYTLWARWNGVFPPFHDVIIQVSYDLVPFGQGSYGLFDYVLETGAGWYGPIGMGTIEVELPYQYDSLNTSYSQEEWSAANRSVQRSDNKIIWHFENLEPTHAHNISVELLNPVIWKDVTEARQAVDVEPRSIDLWLNLAHAYQETVEIKYGLVCCESRVMNVNNAYDRAVALSNNDMDIYIEYLEWMRRLTWPNEAARPDFLAVLARAESVAPNDSRVQMMRDWAVSANEQATQVQSDRATYWAQVTQSQLTATYTERPPRYTATPEPTNTAAATTHLLLTPSATAEIIQTSTPLLSDTKVNSRIILALLIVLGGLIAVVAFMGAIRNRQPS